VFGLGLLCALVDMLAPLFVGGCLNAAGFSLCLIAG
jgi:hypothetical protein